MVEWGRELGELVVRNQGLAAIAVLLLGVFAAVFALTRAARG